MNVDLEKYAKINYFKMIRENMKYLKFSVGILVFLLAIQLGATTKVDKEILWLCSHQRLKVL